MKDHNHHHTQDWLRTLRANNDWMARAILVLAPRQQPDPSTMSRRARKALARARKRTRRGSK